MNEFPVKIEAQYIRAVTRFLNAIDKIILKSVSKNINFRKKNDGLLDISSDIIKLSLGFHKLEALKILKKSTANIMKSVNNFSMKITRNRVEASFLSKRKLKKQPLMAEEKIRLSRITKKFRKTISLSPIKSQDLESIVNFNVNLIETVGQEYIDKIGEDILEHIDQGTSQKDLVNRIQKSTKVERAKAKFWASDQLGKTFSKLTQINQNNAGMSRYIWRTQRDLRVRDLHLDLEGQECSWDTPPLETDHGNFHVGEDYNCRCYAEGIFEDDENSESSKKRLSELIKTQKEK